MRLQSAYIWILVGLRDSVETECAAEVLGSHYVVLPIDLLVTNLCGKHLIQAVCSLVELHLFFSIGPVSHDDHILLLLGGLDDWLLMLLDVALDHVVGVVINRASGCLDVHVRRPEKVAALKPWFVMVLQRIGWLEVEP